MSCLDSLYTGVACTNDHLQLKVDGRRMRPIFREVCAWRVKVLFKRPEQLRFWRSRRFTTA